MWHYKCIRPILNGPTFPTFLCPNCRAVADLEADVEDPGEFEQWDEVPEGNEESQNTENPPKDGQLTPRPSVTPPGETGHSANGSLSELAATMSTYNIADATNGSANGAALSSATPERFVTPAPESSATQPVPIQFHSNSAGLSPLHPQPSGLTADRATDCPMTPRNNVGPFLVDGASRAGQD